MEQNAAHAQPTFLFIEAAGVLTSLTSSWLQPDNAPLADTLDPFALRLVERLCKVLSTQVIMAPHPQYQTVGQWRTTLQEKGVDIPVVDVLPTEEAYWPYHQAAAYMSTRAPSARWAFLLPDDTPAFHTTVCTDKAKGLTVRELLSVVELLAPKSDLRFNLARLLED